MKNLLIFASGCVVGAFGTFLYLHKDFKKKCSEMASTRVSEHSESSKSSENGDDDDLPFIVGESKVPVVEKMDDGESRNKPNSFKTRYDSLVRQYEKAADVAADMKNNEDDSDEVPDIQAEEDAKQEMFYEELKRRPQFEPIMSMVDYNDSEFQQESYVWYKGDNVFCTDNGTIIERPALLVGSEWVNWIGMVKKNTALVRDNKRIMNIDILVEPGLYSDEYGDYYEEE